ncbi:MAG TPA: hypothetical protein VHF05_02790 [Candidatus Paceibacterota bacterium]|jgi:hypothetical protein|nr:hypothetical protein [Candidatus Paceibacterota bacterium]
MIDQITDIVKKNWEKIPEAARAGADPERISVTKFHHGRALSKSKVLFLVTSKDKLVCLVKAARTAEGNEKLRRERDAQVQFGSTQLLKTPAVYFDGLINGSFFYAEEVVDGRPLSLSEAQSRESEIIAMIASWPAEGTVSTSKIAEVFGSAMKEEDTDFKNLHNSLTNLNANLKKGMTHGDFTRKNILKHAGGFYLVDWDRAFERPFWLLDAVHYLVRSRDIKNFEEWKEKGSPILIKEALVDEPAVSALYLAESLLELLYKRSPESYLRALEGFSRL